VSGGGGWIPHQVRNDRGGKGNSNIEQGILNGEAEIGGVLRGGWFNRFLDKPASAGKLGMRRTGDGNLAHSAPLRTCFGWGVRGISNFRLQKFQISAFAGTSFRLRGKDDFRLQI